MNKKLMVVLILSAVILTVAAPVFAQVQSLTFNDVVKILNRLANWMLIVLLAIAIIMIIISAYKYLTAGGDEGKITAAHKTLVYALIAIGIGLLAKGLIFLVGELVGSPYLPSF